MAVLQPITTLMLRRNVIANYLGHGWAALMGVAFVPFYARHLGMAAYGLVGVFAVLQAGMLMLDMGITPTLTREMARLRGGAHTAESIRNLLRSLETVSLGLAAITIAGVWLSASYLASGWLNAQQLPAPVVVHSIQIMGFVIAARWLEQVYKGAIQGLQDMVWLSTVQGVLATLRWGGAYLVVVFVSPTISAFFLWQGAVSMLTVVVLVFRTYHLLPASSSPAEFSLVVLRPVARFAGGMFLSAMLTVLLTQTDKLVISKLLSLDQLGYYALASTVAGGLIQLMIPMNTAVYPRLTEQLARQDSQSLANTYLTSCEWMAIIIVPPALLLTFYPEPTLLFWTGDPVLGKSVAPLLSLLALGTLCNGFVNLPYMLQLAHGWTRLAVQVNTIAVAVIIPVILWLVPRYGAVGAAAAWLALNASYLVVTINLMHRRLFPALKWKWYRVAVVGPFAAGGAVAVVLASVLPVPDSRLSAAMIVLLATGSIATAVVASSALAREAALRLIKRVVIN